MSRAQFANILCFQPWDVTEIPSHVQYAQIKWTPNYKNSDVLTGKDEGGIF